MSLYIRTNYLQGDKINKRLLLFAFVLFIISILILSDANQQITSSLSNSSIITGNLILTGNTIAYSTFGLNSTSFLEAGFQAHAPIDFYIANSSAFSILKPSVIANQSVFQSATGLQNNGVEMIINNATRGIYPYVPSYNGLFARPYGQPSYYNKTPFLPVGAYYLIFQNLGSKNNSIIFYYYKRAVLNSQFILSSVNPGSVIGTLAFIASLALGFYSLVAKSGKDKAKGVKEKQKEKKEKREPENEIEKAYKRLEMIESQRRARRKRTKSRKNV